MALALDLQECPIATAFRVGKLERGSLKSLLLVSSRAYFIKIEVRDV
jgi:hypothetical protein